MSGVEVTGAGVMVTALTLVTCAAGVVTRPGTTVDTTE